MTPSPATGEGAEIVVAGGGTAGRVVAGRLAEAGHDVLLLAAGPDYGLIEDGRWPSELLGARTLGTSHDWGLPVQVQTIMHSSSSGESCRRLLD